MFAGVLHGPRDLRYEKVPIPPLKPEDVLIEIAANGICGSDIHFFEDGKLGPFVVSKPYIPGHEACGIVVKGANIKTGQRVAIEPGIPCRKCRYCKGGRYNLCPDVIFLSAPPVNGTIAQYAALPSDFAHPLPDTIDDEAGAFIEPVSVGIQACDRGGLRPGHTVLILGAGPIGLLAGLVAKSYGAAAVFIADLLETRLSLALSLGFDGVLCDMTGGEMADIVIDTTGSSKAAAEAPLLTARGGTIVHVGWPETASFPYPVESIIEGELNVVGVNRYCNTYPKAISLMSAGKINVGPLVSHRYRLEQVAEAFSYASENRSSVMKIIVTRD